MKTIAMSVLPLPLALLALAPFLAGEPVPQATTAPDEWLQGLVGDWHVEGAAASTDTGGETAVSQAVESIRPIGSFWIVSEGTIPFGNGAITYLRTLGYDQGAKRFVGTWVDSTSSHLWVYLDASLDAEGKALTLESEGPASSGGTPRYREVIQLDGPNRRVHENFIQGNDGTWTSFEKSVFLRKE